VPDSGRWVRRFPWAFGINADQLHLEMASHNFEDTKALSAWRRQGSRHRRAERQEPQRRAHRTHRRRIRATIAMVPPERVCISTDCSVASLRRIVAQKKLRALVEGTTSCEPS